jgi:hypothetical protein
MNPPRADRRFAQINQNSQNNQYSQTNQIITQRNNPFGRLPVQRPMPGKTEV